MEGKRKEKNETSLEAESNLARHGEGSWYDLGVPRSNMYLPKNSLRAQDPFNWHCQGRKNPKHGSFKMGGCEAGKSQPCMGDEKRGNQGSRVTRGRGQKRGEVLQLAGRL